MEGILAVGGFWLCMIAIVLKKPFMAYIEKTKELKSQSDQLIDARVQQLEQAVATLGGNFSELKETTEFAQKMMIESSKKLNESHQLLVESTHRLATTVQKPQIAAVVAPAAQAPQQTPVAQPTPQHQLLTYDANLGKIVDDQAVRFERVLPASVDRVWQYLTKSDFLSAWLAVATVEPRVGGRVDLHFEHDDMPNRSADGLRIRGLVSAYEAGKHLAFSWIDTVNNLDSSVSFELTSAGDQTLLVVNHSRLPKRHIHEFMASWHAHLDVLFARLQNAMPPSFPKRYRELLQTYAMVATSIVISTGPAMASVSGDAYQAIQVERNHLMTKYDSVWRDADELQRQISALKRESSDEASRTLGRLDTALQNDFRDLHDIELEIKDIDRVVR